MFLVFVRFAQVSKSYTGVHLSYIITNIKHAVKQNKKYGQLLHSLESSGKTLTATVEHEKLY